MFKLIKRLLGDDEQAARPEGTEVEFKVNGVTIVRFDPFNPDTAICRGIDIDGKVFTVLKEEDYLQLSVFFRAMYDIKAGWKPPQAIRSVG